MIGSNTVEDRPSSALLSFRDKFIFSRQFAQLYREGMDLVEETAEYLDRAGRLESKRLPPQVSIAYTSESIKLTTRLTQLASWLLVRRAIAIGEITTAEAHTHRHKVALAAQSSILPERFDELPEPFKRLIGESHRLYGRILRLDPLLSEGYSAIAANASPLSPHIERIKHAFPAA
jgi:regulator of CtrA degradation